MARLTRDKMLAQSTGAYNGPKTQYLNLTVDAKTPRITRRLRFIGLPISYWEFRAEKKVDPSDPKSKWAPIPFIDDHLYERKRYTRNGWRDAADVQKRGVCPWDQMGYRPGKKYAIVVIERASGEEGEDVVKVLNKGKQLFVDCLTDWEVEQENDDEDVTTYSGEVTYDFDLVVKYNPSNENQPIYKLKAVGKPSPLSEDDIELLKAAYAPNAEELEAIYAEDPDLRDFPAWYTYGANLNRLFGPTPLKTEGDSDKESTPTRVTKSENISFSDDDDDEKPAPKAKPSPTRAAKSAPAPKENPFDNMENDDEDNEELGEIPNF